MPLEQDVKSSHSESQASFEIRPRPMSDVFEVANGSEHGQHSLDNHTNIPCFGLTNLQVLRVFLLGVEPMVCQNQHSVFKGLDQGMKRGIVYIGGGESVKSLV